ncbi:MAG: hypothetical protein C0609_01585 [Deltaproteobacteria bacterium]|nr:MAG: hypothetical protein C0609_01585 [Deltaproteobacteria bacterium]
MRKKIFLAFFSLLLIFVSGSLISSKYIVDATEGLHRLLQMHKIDDMSKALSLSIRTVQMDLFSLRTPASRDLDTIITNVRQMEGLVNKCYSCHHKEWLVKKFNNMSEGVRLYKSALSLYVTSSANTPRMERLGIEATQIGEALMERVLEVSSLASVRFGHVTEESLGRIKDVRLILLGTLALTFLIGVIAAIHITRALMAPLGVFIDGTRKIASGQLGHKVPSEGMTEFRELAEYFNKMSEELKRAHEEQENTNRELNNEIIERKHAEEEKNRLMDQLVHARKLEAIGTLSGGIAHEFNNLLQVIQGCADLMDITMEKDSASRKHLSTIIATANRGGDLTKRLLAFSRKVDGESRVMDLNTKLGQVFVILQQTLPRNIDIELKLSSAPATIAADPSGIEQLLLNMALNAKDAMADGGRLTLTTRLIDAKACKLEGNLGKDDNCVLLDIADNGCGMDEQTRALIFDPFFTTKDVGAGTGLGLSVTYGLVNAYGGYIECKSSLGEGTTFSIYFPYAKEDVLESVPRERQLTFSDVSGGRVLIADDEHGIIESAAAVLESMGYDVVTASTGEDAIEICKKERIDLVALDLGMPGIGGVSCLETISTLPEPRPKVIITTGYGFDDAARSDLLKKAERILQKPYRLTEFISAVSEALLEK